LKLRKNRRIRHFIEDEIAFEKRMRATIVNAIGEPKKREALSHEAVPGNNIEESLVSAGEF
jgi:hypothetical protein